MLYFKTTLGKLYYGNCIPILKSFPSKSVDLIVTDPPYLIEYKTNHRIDKKHDFTREIPNDSNRILIQKFLYESYRILKDNKAMYVFCSWKTVDLFKTMIKQAGFIIRNMIIWVKNNWTAGDLEAQFGQRYEIIILGNKGRAKIRGKRLTDVWFFDRVAGNKQLHQNQKPLDLIKQCIEKHSDEGDLVLDPFLGSGTTAVACELLNRRWIGIEIQKKYCDIAKKRLSEIIQRKRSLVYFFTRYKRRQSLW